MFCYGYYLGEALLQSDLQDVALVEVKPRDAGRHLAEGCDYDSAHGPWGRTSCLSQLCSAVGLQNFQFLKSQEWLEEMLTDEQIETAAAEDARVPFIAIAVPLGCLMMQACSATLPCYAPLPCSALLPFYPPLPCANTPAVLMRVPRRRMNAALRLLYRGGAWLAADEAALIGEHGLTALRAMQRCAEISLANREPLYPLHAKMHMLFHQFRFLCQYSKKCCWVESPLTDACQMDEGFVGVVARLSRRVSPKTTIRRTLDLYLCLLHKHWTNQPVQSDEV